jgi:type IV pilus assembly protein PilY1
MKIENMKPKHTFLTTAIAGTMALGLSGNAISAPGSLATSPLFLQAVVQPNIFLMVDDSGSMDWEVLKSAGALTDHGTGANSGNLDFTPNTDIERLELCVGYNALAYNPGRTYTPWQGLDGAGNPYINQTLAAARTDPYNTATANITSHFYFVWNDANSDGVYQNGECPTPAVITSCGAEAGCVQVNSLSAAQQTNYANWYSYYRKREYVMKRAMSSIITRSTARAGMGTLHNNNTVRTLVTDIDDITLPVNPTAAANKAALLRNLFRIDSSGGTPLRQGLQDVGDYYEGGNSWGASPILPAASGGECQQNFTILLSDGYWNGGDPNVGDADSDNSTIYDGGAYADGDTASTISNTLADVAMHYYERDLDTSMANKVRTIAGIDDNQTQHMVTYTVAFGINGTLSNNPLPTDTGFNWPTPTADTATTIDDMRHAAFNGRGQFLNAGNPQNLIDSLNQQIADIQARTGTAAAVTFNSTSLQAGSRVFQATFNSERWSGDLTAIDINFNPTTGLASVGGVAWKASTDIDNRVTPRQFVTFDGSSGVALPSNIDSAWSALTAAQKDDLRTNSGGTLDTEATGKARLDYIRGARGCELNNAAGVCSYSDSGGNTFTGKTLRERSSALSDIVHSSPFFVGAPATPYPDDIEATRYSSFAATNSARTGMAYVGSNGGTLHAFNENGQEIFSYVPNLLFSTQGGSGLHYLSDPAYTHRYHVDLSPIVQDAYVNAAWRSILVGGLRGGGKGLFAMDVTDPAALNFDASPKVMWEFTHADLGYTFSDIRIGKMNNGKWAAIFGNGYNNDPSGDGRAKLFVLYLDGSNLGSPVIIDTGAGSMVNNDCGDASSDCNGMSTPAIVDLNGDGTIDRIYSGDLHGNMWAFDVTSSNSASWNSVYGSNPLFKACTGATCSAAARQPITVKPSIARHATETSISTKPNLMVFFGTGQYIVAGDNSSSQQQTFYGVWDSGNGNLRRDSLVAQSITTTADPTLGNVRTISDAAVNYNSKKGWLIELPVTKERSVTNPLALGSILFFNTMIPSTNICDAGGTGWLMAVDQLNGGMPSFAPVDVNGDGVFDALDELNGTIVVGTESTGIPTESRFISNKRITADSAGNVGIDNVQPALPKQPARMSWTGLE